MIMNFSNRNQVFFTFDIMKKYLLAFITVISIHSFSQDSLQIKQRWNQKSELPFYLSYGLDFDLVDGVLYSNYKKKTDEAVYYPDIERSMNNSHFFKLDDHLNLIDIQSKEICDQIFLKTDSRTKWSPFISVERGYNSEKDHDGNWKHTWEVSCSFEGKKYTDKIVYRSAPNRWYGVQSSLIADSSGLNAVFIGQSCLEGVFAKVYFIHFHKDSKRFEIAEKEMLYSDLEFNTDKLIALNNYKDHEFRLNGQPGDFFCFNIENSSKLGIASVVFDTDYHTFTVTSKEINKDEYSLLPEFNEVEIEIYPRDEESFDCFLGLIRGKISQGKESNTTLDFEVGKDVLYFNFDGSSYPKTEKISGASQNQVFSGVLGNSFVFVYDRKPEFDQLQPIRVVDKQSNLNVWVYQHSKEKDMLYEVPLSDEEPFHESIFENYLSLVAYTPSVLKMISFVSGDEFESTKQYRIGEITIDINQSR